MATIRSRSTDAVSATAPASIEPLRLPPVPAPNGVSAVSPWMVWTSAMSTPRASAVSCTTVVSRLLPRRPARDVHVDLARRLDADRGAFGAVASRSPGVVGST